MNVRVKFPPVSSKGRGKSFYFEIFFSKQVVIPLVVSLVQLVDSRIHFVVGKIKKTEKMD